MTKQEYGKRYRAKHKLEEKQRKAKWYIDNKEKINKKHLQYQQEHKEELKEYRKQYWETYKDIINAKRRLEYANKNKYKEVE